MSYLPGTQGNQVWFLAWFTQYKNILLLFLCHSKETSPHAYYLWSMDVNCNVILCKKNIILCSTERKTLLFNEVFSTRKTFYLWLCNYLNNIVIVEFKTLVTNYTKLIGRAKTNKTMVFCQFVMNKGKVIKFPSILLCN